MWGGGFRVSGLGLLGLRVWGSGYYKLPESGPVHWSVLRRVGEARELERPVCGEWGGGGAEPVADGGEAAK